MVNNHGVKIDLKTPELVVEDGVYKMVSKFGVKMTEQMEEAVFDAILETAIEEGLDTVIILNKQFIVDAIREKLERETKGEGYVR